MHQRHRCAPRWDTFTGRGTLHSPNQPSNHCTVRAQRRFERHGIKVEIMLVRSGDAKEAARGDVFMMKQTLLGARLPKGSGSTQARVRTSAPEVLKGAGSNGVRAGSSGALAEVRLRPALPAWAVTILAHPDLSCRLIVYFRVLISLCDPLISGKISAGNISFYFI